MPFFAPSPPTTSCRGDGSGRLEIEKLEKEKFEAEKEKVQYYSSVTPHAILRALYYSKCSSSSLHGYCYVYVHPPLDISIKLLMQDIKFF